MQITDFVLVAQFFACMNGLFDIETFVNMKKVKKNLESQLPKLSQFKMYGQSDPVIRRYSFTGHIR